jgi:hypothetical protein
VLLIRASEAASIITYYAKVEIRVVNSSGTSLTGVKVGIQSVNNKNFICRDSNLGVLWNGTNAVNYSTSDTSGYAHYAYCIVYQASYTSYSAAPLYNTGQYKLISVTRSGLISSYCSQGKNIVPGSVFSITGTKNGNGTLPVTYQVTCMVPAPVSPPPAPPPSPTPSPTPKPSPSPSPSPTPSPSPSPSPNPTSPTPPSNNPRTTTRIISPPPPAPAIVKAASGDTTPPEAPQNFTATLDGSDAQLSWDAATDNVGVVSYSLERSNDQTSWEYLSQDTTDTLYTDPGLSNSTNYFYRLRSIDAAGNVSAGAFADVQTTPGETASKQSTSGTKSKNNKHTGLKAGGILLILLALGASVIWWLRWRAARAAALDEQTRIESFENLQSTTGDAAPHSGESLAHMVLDDLHQNDVHPPKPKK